MLELAIDAGIPIIAVRTTDMINLHDVMQSIAPGCARIPKVHAFDGVSYVVGANDELVTPVLYDSLVGLGAVLVLINPTEVTDVMFDAGTLPTPPELVETTLLQVVDKEEVMGFMKAVQGLTIKQMVEVIKLAQALAGQPLTVRSIMTVRSMLVGSRPGLQLVDPKMDFYIAEPQLIQWASVNKKYFIEGLDHRLVPRGLLLNGDPGVGKTQGAKYLAQQFGVELYRLDLAGSLSKWHGESEGRLQSNLQALDQEEPCIVLIDEIEKVFAKNDDLVAGRLLSQLLWWLQEHKSRVLTVMTTNHMDVIPTELYRPGRIDKMITIQRLELGEAKKMAKKVLQQFVPDVTESQKLTTEVSVSQHMINATIPHANVVSIVQELVKLNQWVT